MKSSHAHHFRIMALFRNELFCSGFPDGNDTDCRIIRSRSHQPGPAVIKGDPIPDMFAPLYEPYTGIQSEK